jgi:hypothetical protein
MVRPTPRGRGAAPSFVRPVVADEHDAVHSAAAGRGRTTPEDGMEQETPAARGPTRGRTLAAIALGIGSVAATLLLLGIGGALLSRALLRPDAWAYALDLLVYAAAGAVVVFYPLFAGVSLASRHHERGLDRAAVVTVLAAAWRPPVVLVACVAAVFLGVAVVGAPLLMLFGVLSLDHAPAALGTMALGVLVHRGTRAERWIAAVLAWGLREPSGDPERAGAV